MKTVSVSHAERIVSIKYSGLVVDSDLFLGVTDYRDLGLSYRVLIDLTDVQKFNITPEALRAVVKQSSGPQARGWCALVAPTPEAFGLARMYQVYCDVCTGDPRVKVFTDAELARNWIDDMRVPPHAELDQP